MDVKFHDGMWLGDESIVGMPSGVFKAKTARRHPEDQRSRVEEVF